MSSDITVAIINYNGAQTLEPTIKSILIQKPESPEKIMLFDNKSTDTSIELVRAKFPQVEIHKLPENKGPNPARNLALKMATTTYVLIMDNDIVLAEDYIAKLKSAFKKYPEAGAISGQIRLYDEPEQMQYNGAFIHYVGEVILNKKISEEPIKVPCVSAGAALFRRERTLAIDGFDEDFFIGWEDGDLTFRLSLCGHFSYSVSNAICFHMKRKRGFKWVHFQVRNRLWFILKNYESGTLFLASPAIAFFQIAAFLFFLLKGEGTSVLKGWMAAFQGLADILKKRKKIQELRKISDKHLLTGGTPDLVGDAIKNKLVMFALSIIGYCLSAYWSFVKFFLKDKK